MLRISVGRTLLGAVAVASTLSFGMSSSDAKTPGKTYCFYKVCHRVKTIGETQALVGKEHTLPASFYDDCRRDKYNPCGLTSSGEAFRPMEPDNAASPIYPDGTKLLVWSPATGQAIVLRVNNAGPYWGNRTLDVSKSAAEKLGFASRGVANLKARVLEAPTRAEATYRKGRRYAPVAGAIGRYASSGEAESAIQSIQRIAAAKLAPFNGQDLPNRLDSKSASSVVLALAAFVPKATVSEPLKLPESVVADAEAAAGGALAWPVVSRGVVRTASLRDWPVITKAVAPVARTQNARGRVMSWSQQATMARLDGVARARHVRFAPKLQRQRTSDLQIKKPFKPLKTRG